MASNEDQLLIQRTLDGDGEAFGGLVQKYQHRLFNGMVQILRSEPEAEDIVQDTFVLAYTKLATFQGHSAFFTWLYRIGYNLAVTRIRRHKVTMSLDTQRESGQDFAGDESAPSERMEQLEQAALLMQALDQLSSEHRTILVLREMEEMDYESLSEILDLPIGTVRSRLHRAREQLRELLAAVRG